MPDHRHRTGVLCTVRLEIEVHCYGNKNLEVVDRERDSGKIPIRDTFPWLKLHVHWKRKQFRIHQMYRHAILPLAATINTCPGCRDADNIL